MSKGFRLHARSLVGGVKEGADLRLAGKHVLVELGGQSYTTLLENRDGGLDDTNLGGSKRHCCCCWLIRLLKMVRLRLDLGDDDKRREKKNIKCYWDLKGIYIYQS
jgi:hypothetical protein